MFGSFCYSYVFLLTIVVLFFVFNILTFVCFLLVV